MPNGTELPAKQKTLIGKKALPSRTNHLSSYGASWLTLLWNTFKLNLIKKPLLITVLLYQYSSCDFWNESSAMVRYLPQLVEKIVGKHERKGHQRDNIPEPPHQQPPALSHTAPPKPSSSRAVHFTAALTPSTCNTDWWILIVKTLVENQTRQSNKIERVSCVSWHYLRKLCKKGQNFSKQSF